MKATRDLRIATSQNWKARAWSFVICRVVCVAIVVSATWGVCQVPDALSGQAEATSSRRESDEEMMGSATPRELERMAQLDSYRIRLAGGYSDLMDRGEAGALERMFIDSVGDRPAYIQVAQIGWDRMLQLRTNLTALASFPGPMPTQLRVHVERILMAMTNSPAVSAPLRLPSLMATVMAPDWSIGNLNVAYSEDVSMLAGQLKLHPGDGAIYLKGLSSLFESAKGYFGPVARKRALGVYLNLTAESKEEIKSVLAEITGNSSLDPSLVREASRAHAALVSIWEVIVGGEQYDLSEVAGVDGFLEESDVRTHFMDHLVVLGTIMTVGSEHQEVVDVSSWLLTNTPRRLLAFIDSPLVSGDGIIAREAREISYAITKARFAAREKEQMVASAGRELQNLPAPPPRVFEKKDSRVTAAKNWVLGHIEIVVGGILVLLAVVFVPQAFTEVKFARKRMKKRTLYAVADDVMGRVKDSATDRLSGLEGQKETLIADMGRTVDEFIASAPDELRGTLAYGHERIRELASSDVVSGGAPDLEVVRRSMDQGREDLDDLVGHIVESYPGQIAQNSSEPAVLGTAWSLEFLGRFGLETSRELIARLEAVVESATQLGRVTAIGEDPDQCPPPEDVVTALKGSGVDVGEIIDAATKRNKVGSWEMRYQLNRNADLVIAAYYKKHFNRYIDLVRKD